MCFPCCLLMLIAAAAAVAAVAAAAVATILLMLTACHMLLLLLMLLLFIRFVLAKQASVPAPSDPPLLTRWDEKARHTLVPPIARYLQRKEEERRE